MNSIAHIFIKEELRQDERYEDIYSYVKGSLSEQQDYLLSEISNDTVIVESTGNQAEGTSFKIEYEEEAELQEVVSSLSYLLVGLGIDNFSFYIQRI